MAGVRDGSPIAARQWSGIFQRRERIALLIILLLVCALCYRVSLFPAGNTSWHRRLSWKTARSNGNIIGRAAAVLAVSAEDQYDVQLEVPAWQAPEIAFVANQMMKQYGRLDTKARKDCKLIRDNNAVIWNNHSNYDALTRWRSPGIPGSLFDHAISFKYMRMEGVTPRLKNYQCRLLIRGQDYEALRRLPVVQSIPFTDQQSIGPVITDEDLRMIAVVFPQYHAFKENDLFWGTNFTEWTNLKLAFFNPWNFQPIKHPIGSYGGYYNMLSHSHRTRMEKLARFYGIHGFAYHHYWFECNTVFLESVIMEMLKDGKPDLPFMLIWANEAWTRHWTGETGEILQPQSYGNETCWRLHFQWLLPLFKHPNYIRVNKKPAFGIYIVPLIKELKPMLKLWRALAKEEGLPGLHIIQCLGHKDSGVSRNVNAIMEYQPNLKKGRMKKRIESPRTRLHKNHYRGEYLGWDNFPRHNLDPHFVVGDLDDDPVHVEARLEEKFRIARQDPNNGTTPNLFFLTAWNEWGEGNTLEPNNIFGYGNLNAVALAYEHSKGEANSNIDLVRKLHEAMDECKLKLDIQYYIDLAGADLSHLLGGPEPSMRVIENWQTEGFSKGREFKLVSELEDVTCGGKSHCQFLCGVTLDKHIVRYLLEVDSDNVGLLKEGSSSDRSW